MKMMCFQIVIYFLVVLCKSCVNLFFFLCTDLCKKREYFRDCPKESPQKTAMREMMHDYLKKNDISIKNGADVNSVMRDMMSVLLEGVLDEELDEELGYSKYDYRNKEMENSRNGHSSKTMHTSYGDMEVAIPRDRNGESMSFS